MRSLIGNDQLQLVENRLEIPLARVFFRRRAAVDGVADFGLQRFDEEVAQRLAFEHAAALGVDHLALLVHDVVVLEHLFADLVIVVLDLRLRVLDRFRQDAGFDRRFVGELDEVHHLLNALGAEKAHQLIVERDVEARRARIALTAGTAAQLVVDASRLVALGADDVQAADRGHAFAELDVDAAAGHVGRDRHRAPEAGVLDDLRFLLVILRVEHVALDAAPAQEHREAFGFLDRARADQHRAALFVLGDDLVDDRFELRVLGAIDDVGLVFARDGLVRRHDDDVEAVDVAELALFRLRGTGHAGELP